MKLQAPISAGDLADRISILCLKLIHIENAEKRNNVMHELGLLKTAWSEYIAQTQHPFTLDRMLKKLDNANARIWKLEDAARTPKFITENGTFLTERDRSAMALLLKSITRSNDERAILKRTINRILDSEIVEEKSHTAY